jgi:fibro-slime domain-containing protein
MADSREPAEAAALDVPHVVSSCGDGITLGAETCDDGNTISGDGCSASCRLELGHQCSGSPSQCSPTVCGDGKVEGAETCDDGNAMPFDGCSSDCQIEPDCSGSSGCTSKCGDGIVLGEECDDGNRMDGDGCSSACKTEPGWTCTQPEIGDKMMVSAIFRDFRSQHPTDFERGSVGSYAALVGIVNTTLAANGKPVYSGIGSGANIASADSFSQWFTDVSGVSHATAPKMALWKDGKGNYVNRYGANGEQWNITMPANWCGTVGNELLDAGGNPTPCTYQPRVLDGGGAVGQTDCEKLEAQGYTRVPGSCKADSGGTYSAKYLVRKTDGNPLFFPVDGDSFTPASERMSATIPPYYDESQTWPSDMDAAGNKVLHNFSFTSEIHSWFLYDASKTYTLDFMGDDDVWVFINKKLVVDLGGVHTPVDGSLVIDTSGKCTTTVTPTYPKSPVPASTKETTTLALEDGKVYEIAVFQAERQSNSSTLLITLPPFNTGPSECTPK